MLQSVGLGKLRPNTLLLGYMNRWQDADVTKVDEYYGMIHDAFDLRYGVGILRLQVRRCVCIIDFPKISID